MPGLFPEKVNVREDHDLTFPSPREKELFEGDGVEFWGQDGQTRVRCVIERDALDDHFGGDRKEKLAVFRVNRKAIEEIARRKYLAGRREADGSVLIGSEDF
jgi:hypothetical protein